MNDRIPSLPVLAAAALPMSAEQVRDHVNSIQTVMQAVMKEKVHYGTIPGTPKPTLYKPGAEVLCMAFHIDPNYDVQDLSTADYYRYRVRCIGRHQQSEIKLGEGMGSASSSEEKYKWRKAVCDEEFEAAAESRKRIKFGKDKEGGFYMAKQLRAEPDDIDNTVLKMACKRAHIAMVLNVLAASDIFTQDIEDLPEHLRSEEATDPALTAKWVAAAAGAPTAEALKKVWDEGKVVLRDANDAVAYQALKKAIKDRGAALKANGADKEALSDAEFAEKLAKWTEVLAKGKKTADEIIATAQSKNALTEGQIAAIRGAGAPSAAKGPKGTAPDAEILAVLKVAEENALTDADMKKYLGVGSLTAISNEQLAKLRAFVADPMGASK